MTEFAHPARGDHWLRAIVYGLLAEVATIISIIIIAMVYRHMVAPGQAAAAYAAFGERAGGIVGIVGGTIYTFLFAQLLMRRLSSRQIAHGIVVAIAAIALSIGGSLTGHRGVPMGYLAASLLKLSAGVLAGFLAARRTGVVTA